MAEALSEYDNIKMWEAKQSREITSATSWEGNKLSNGEALPRHSLSSCSVFFFKFPRTFSPVAFSQSLRSQSLSDPPPPSSLFLVQPSSWNVYVFIFQMNFLTLICFLLLLAAKQIFTWMIRGRVWHVRHFALSLFPVWHTLISEKHNSIRGRSTERHLLSPLCTS